MTDLEFLQLLIIFTIIFWIFLQVKKKSKFGAGPSLELPWNVNFEKNKVYILLNDPLKYDLGIETRTVYTGPLVRYSENEGYTKTNFAIGITMDEDERLSLITDIDGYVSFQNKIIEDINALTTTFVNFNGIKVNFDYSAITKLNVSNIDKYNSLTRGFPYANLLQCEDFKTIYLADGTIIEPKFAWDISDSFTGSTNASVSGDVLYYQNFGPTQTNVPDETSVSFYGGIGSLGRYSTLSFPPYMYDPQDSTSQAAVLEYINIKNNTFIKPPYLRQTVNLKKNLTYSLNFFYFGFIPLFINLVDTSTSTWTRTIIGTQNDISYNTWFYNNKIDFTVPKDGAYMIEFTPMTVGNELLYPGTDPEGNSHKYHGRCMIQKVILKVNDSKTKFTGYTDLLYSPGVQEKTLYIVFNGKLLRLNMNTYDSIEPAQVNKRRDDISKFITKNYIM
jgi:hypothetical protein